MHKRLATISIFIKNKSQVEKINQILTEFGECIISRMGIPYREKKISVIAVIVDATIEDIGSLSGKLGTLKGVTVKTAVQKNSK